MVKATHVYAVFREGVYRHECCGIFTEHDKAIETADLFASTDRDSYHTYQVVPFVLGAKSDVEQSSYHSHDIIEAKPVYEVKKSDIVKDPVKTALAEIMEKAAIYPPGEPWSDFDSSRYRKD